MRLVTTAAWRWKSSLLTFSSVAVLTLSSCVFKDVREQQAEIDSFCAIAGTVTTERPSTNPLIVGLVRHTGGGLEDTKNWALTDHFISESGGRWLFRVSPNTYGLVAFEDTNSDSVYQPTEPFLRIDPAKVLSCKSAERMTDLALVIPAQGRSRMEGSIDFMAFQARTAVAQQQVSLGLLTVYGKVTTLDDPRFRDEVAANSLWRPYDFLVDVGAGMYFLEPYDAKKIPVLFVHGINGTPSNFRTLIGQLDRNKYQPWVYYYPSGSHLDLIAGHLDQTMKNLQLEHGFNKYHVIAHSMGGLVSRGFLLRNQTAQTRAHVPLYITIATPWGGHKAAESGIKYSPAVVRVWNDMVPGSAYIKGLFFEERNGQQAHRPLPTGLDHHLLFDFKQSGMGMGEANDGVVTVSSQLFAGAQTDAVRLYGFDETHMGVLDSKEVSQLVNRLLDEASK
jgi:pimeloyl-ACP methyl ester carboxylesterase